MPRNLTLEKTKTPFRRRLTIVSPPLQISKRIFTATDLIQYSNPGSPSIFSFSHSLHRRFSKNSLILVKNHQESSANLNPLRRAPPQKPPSGFQFHCEIETKMKRGLGTKRERKHESGNVKDGIESFWTICPYCYYIYEYELAYLDCCLRCQNCNKAFHAVAIKGPLPKTTVVEGKELYNVNLALFKICYSIEELPIVDDEEKNADVEVGYKTEDLMDVDVGSSNMQRRRVIANHDGTSGHLNINEFCEQLQGKLSTIEEDDDRAKQEIKQSQSRTGGELSSNVQIIKSGLMADHLENGFNEESEFGELEFYMGYDDIYVGLADL